MDEQKPIIDITSEPSGPHIPGTGQYPSASAAAAFHTTGPSRGRREPLLVRRRWTVLTILILAGIAVGFWASMQPSQYRASGAILISRAGSPAPVSESELATEIEMLRSRTGELTTGLGGGAAGTRIAESIQAAETRRAQLKHTVSLRTLGDSQVIEVSFTDPSRKAAADSVNALMDLYLEHRFRIYSAPSHLVPVEAERAVLESEANRAVQDLKNFDRDRDGLLAQQDQEAKNRLRTLLEERLLDLKASIRGQEAVVQALRQRFGDAHPETLQAESKLAGWRAQMHEVERSLTPVAQALRQAAVRAGQREELKVRAERIAGRAERVADRVQEARMGSMTLQAKILTRAEPVLLRPWNAIPWWAWCLGAAGAFFTALLGAWLVDLFDRPVYHDDDFANLTGAPPIKSRAAGAGD